MTDTGTLLGAQKGIDLIPEINRQKQEKMLDIIRRVIANPENAKEVAEQLAMDWFPLCEIDEKGISFVIGHGKKK